MLSLVRILLARAQYQNNFEYLLLHFLEHSHHFLFVFHHYCLCFYYSYFSLTSSLSSKWEPCAGRKTQC